VGTFPPHLLNYAVAKLLTNGMVVVHLEGGFLLLALLGLFYATRRTADPDTPLSAARPPLARFVLWVAVFHLGSILFILKGGTVNYIWVIAEPIVALFAAHTLALLGRLWQRTVRDLHPTAVLGRALAGFCLACLLLVPPGRLLSALWMMNWPTAGEGEAVRAMRAIDPGESGEATVSRALGWISANSSPGDLILTPGFYAFLSGRVVAGESSSTFILGMRYFNAREAAGARDDETLGQALARLGPAAPESLKQVDAQLMEVVRAMRERRVRVVFWRERRHPFYQIPELVAALEANYHPVPGQWIQNVNERLQLYLPN